jgi:hypothetical protein
MVKFFEGLPLFPSTILLRNDRLRLDEHVHAQSAARSLSRTERRKIIPDADSFMAGALA